MRLSDSSIEVVAWPVIQSLELGERLSSSPSLLSSQHGRRQDVETGLHLMANLDHTTGPLTSAEKRLESTSIHSAQELIDGALADTITISLSTPVSAKGLTCRPLRLSLYVRDENDWTDADHTVSAHQD
jgi:hypothetical protein